AKYHWDDLMRRHGRPWTLGEVLSGGIGGFVHWFVPGGPCYGCVASYLQRSVTVAKDKAPDYSQPGGPAPETTIPASQASIHAIAALHALVTLGLLRTPRGTTRGSPASCGRCGGCRRSSTKPSGLIGSGSRARRSA
ncbi:MAG: hypothetical protein JO112_14475, partial [Planctomycetes bacterium]|nr:hypothetical protein [Planctomycetota bacterium]